MAERDEPASKPAEIRTREALYQAVWAEPISLLALRYGISGVSIAKLCRRVRVPIPGRGYWAQLAAGKRPPIAKLQDAEPGLGLYRPLVPLDAGVIEARSAQAAELRAIKASIATGDLPELGKESHPLARVAKQRLSQRKGWEPNCVIRSAPEEVLAIYVSAGAVDRACRFASVLLLALEKVGAAITHDAKIAKTLVTLEDTSLPLAINEHVARTKHVNTRSEERALQRWRESIVQSHLRVEYPHVPDHDYTATGQLTLTVGHYPNRNWRDTPVRGLEHRLGEIVVDTLALARELAARARAEELRAANYQAKQEAYEQALARWTDEREALRQAIKDARRWEDADRLRRFARAASTSGRATIDAVPTEEWVPWAIQKADWLDPLVRLPDEILDADRPEPPTRW